MGFKCGIVGLPNVGKSTLFNALTEAGIAAENYPFCTIEPNVGLVAVPDERLQQLADIVKPKAVVPACMEFVDIAGLVAGASKGEGLGNQFLAHIRDTQAIVHVVRCFEDENIVHVTGKSDPLADIETINTELALADLSTVERALEREVKRAKSGHKQALIRRAVLDLAQRWLDRGLPIRAMEINEQERHILRELQLLTAKPVLYIANVAEARIEDNPWVDVLGELAAKEGAASLSLCAALDGELAGLSENEKREFLSALGLQELGVNRLIKAGYQLLGLHTYFTAGPKEVRAWTLAKGAKAPQAAGVIHTDFERGFIRAEVVAFEDFVRFKGETGAKEAGKWRLEGRDYVVQDGDVIHFRFNV